MNSSELSELELDLLLLFYAYSDEHGKVDMPRVKEQARKKLNLILPDKQIYIKQIHVNALVERGLIPSIDNALQKAKQKLLPRK